MGSAPDFAMHDVLFVVCESRLSSRLIELYPTLSTFIKGLDTLEALVAGDDVQEAVKAAAAACVPAGQTADALKPVTAMVRIALSCSDIQKEKKAGAMGGLHHRASTGHGRG